MRNLFTFLLTIGTATIVSGADVRIINNVRVDIAPVHAWFDGGRKSQTNSDRPLPNWKQIQILEVTFGGAFPLCSIKSESRTKTVYLKNVPPTAAQYWGSLNSLKSKIKNLQDQIAIDKKRLRSAENVDAEYGSEYYQNRDNFRVSLQNNEDDLRGLQRQISELKAAEKASTSDFAVFTGQVYGKLEVWDCGLKTQ